MKKLPHAEVTYVNETYSLKENEKLDRGMVEPNGMVTFKDDHDRIPEFNIDISATTVYVDQQLPKVQLYNPIVVLRVSLYREPDYMIFSIFAPLLLLNLSALSVFVLGPSDFANKLSILVTLLLAMFAFTLFIRQSIPSLPSLTFLEKHILNSIVILFISILESVITALIGEGDTATIVKFVVFCIACLLALISSVYVFVVWHIITRKNVEIDDKNKSYKNSSAKKSTSAKFNWNKYKHQTIKESAPDTERSWYEKKL